MMSRFERWPAILILLAALPCTAAEEKPAAGDLQTEAQGFVGLLVEEKFDAAVERFDDTMKEALPADKLREVWESIQQQAGLFEEQDGARSAEEGGYRVVYVRCRFERTALDAKVVYDDDGLIAGLFFLPAEAASSYRLPGYAHPERFRDREVTVGEGRWALPGTLSLPLREGPFPGLVLVHGSGPHDRDETIGSNKPFSDLATGLASRGIAVLRYVKRTQAHAGEMEALKEKLTLEEETIADALAAVRLLRATEDLDGDRVFVLGHSLGGMALPRIAKRDAAIAGFIMMATPSRPLEDLLPEQFAYIFSLDDEISEEERTQLDELEKQVARVKDARALETAAPGDLPLGAGRAYWSDLRAHRTAEIAASLRRPLLILQGGRDYQVTEEDFDGWRRALNGHANVVLKLHPDLNHLFMPGRGKSTPAEYHVAGHVALSVIEDVAAFIREARTSDPAAPIDPSWGPALRLEPARPHA